MKIHILLPSLRAYTDLCLNYSHKCYFTLLQYYARFDTSSFHIAVFSYQAIAARRNSNPELLCIMNLRNFQVPLTSWYVASSWYISRLFAHKAFLVTPRRGCILLPWGAQSCNRASLSSSLLLFSWYAYRCPLGVQNDTTWCFTSVPTPRDVKFTCCIFCYV